MFGYLATGLVSGVGAFLFTYYFYEYRIANDKKEIDRLRESYFDDLKMLKEQIHRFDNHHRISCKATGRRPSKCENVVLGE